MRKLKRVVWRNLAWGAVCVISLSCTTSKVGTTSLADLVYEDALILVNEEPRWIPSQLAGACTSLIDYVPRSVEERNKNQSTWGPHGRTSVRNYVSEDIAKQLDENPEVPPLYSVGSVITKEKLQQTQEGAWERTGLGGMIKRDDPEYLDTGGWEFFYVYESRIDRGKISSCVECHSKSKTKDFVFGDYLEFWGGGNEVTESDQSKQLGALLESSH